MKIVQFLLDYIDPSLTPNEVNWRSKERTGEAIHNRYKFLLNQKKREGSPTRLFGEGTPQKNYCFL
jgi:hypothetical protein